ncbi:DUF7519 family protein [Natrialba asiatica]|uniref:Uncharacterized protein n=1 Tax=Natrialba asiatica (strain ATCC 700177 / DSM 12278 / JCM 9576 / FERM P-10747 / NBRC 102637 / 172P1) TaxID=29540 RepID=M0AWK8_NATA1|nr:hypothetical protein [Natrialba asiatica]ELZ02358.1 hypothetical protein C481_06796 [Natrialba asiatica DSM 12278]
MTPPPDQRGRRRERHADRGTGSPRAEAEPQSRPRHRATAGPGEREQASDRDQDRNRAESRDYDPDGAAGPVTLTRKPTLFSSGCALAAALVTTAMAALASGITTPGVGVTALGVAVLAAGLYWAHPRTIDIGALVLLVGLIVAGARSPAVEPLVVGTVTTVLAWDLGHSGLTLGTQLGRDTRTIRLELVQLGSSLLVGLLSGTIGYAVYTAGTGNLPASAIVLLLVAVTLIIVSLGTKRSRSPDRKRKR